MVERKGMEHIFKDKIFLFTFSPLVVTVCANPQKYTSLHLQATASLSLTKLMIVSSDFCERHLQVHFSIINFFFFKFYVNKKDV